MVLGMGVPELLVILLVVLVIFGPKNLPKIGTAIGKTVKNVREGMEEGGGSDGDGSAKAQKSEATAKTFEDDSDDDGPISES